MDMVNIKKASNSEAIEYKIHLLSFMVFDNLLAFHNVRKNHFEWLIFIYVAEMDWRTSFLLHMSPVSTTSWMLTQVMSKNNHWKSTDKSCLFYVHTIHY